MRQINTKPETEHHMCERVAVWCSDEETSFLDVKGTHDADHMQGVLDAHGMPEELRVTGVAHIRGHWVTWADSKAEAEMHGENFGLDWRADPDGCHWTRASCEWRD